MVNGWDGGRYLNGGIINGWTEGYDIKKWGAKDHVSKEIKFPIPRIGKWKKIWWERMCGNGNMVRRLANGGREGMCSSKACMKVLVLCL